MRIVSDVWASNPGAGTIAVAASFFLFSDRRSGLSVTGPGVIVGVAGPVGASSSGEQAAPRKREPANNIVIATFFTGRT